MRDVGEVYYTDQNGQQREKYFLVSASAGIVARGNQHFNSGGLIINLIKKRSTNLAIIYTFFKTLLSYQNIPFELIIDDIGQKKPAFHIPYWSAFAVSVH